MARSHTARNRQVTTLERFDVFISYSRRDVEFVRQLDQRLQGQKRTTWVDWGSVRPGSEFPPRIRAGVEGASNFVFIVSPESVISEWCRLELAHAVKHGKRLVSILLHPVDPKQMPKAIRTLHWIDFHSGSLDSAVATLIEVIDTDQDWIDEHTRVLQRGLEWEAQPDDGFLLRGQELTAAVKWLGGASETSTRRLSTLHRTFIEASQAAQQRELRRWRELSQKYLAGRLSAESKLAREESPRLLTRSVLLAIESLRLFPSVEAHNALDRALPLLPNLVKRHSHQSAVSAVAFSPRGTWCASADCEGRIQMTNLETLETSEIFGHQGRVNALSFRADEKFLAVASDDKTASVWDLADNRTHCVFPFDEAVSTVEFAAEGTLLLTATGRPGHPGITTLCDAENGRIVGTLDRVSISKLYARGKTLATAEANRIVFREAVTGTVIADLHHDAIVTAFDIHDAQPMVAVVTFDGSLWLLGQAEGGRIFRDGVATGISRLGPVALSPDGGKVAARRADSQICVWDVASRKESFRFGHKGSAGTNLLAFDSSGRYLASLSSEDQSISVWDTETQNPLMCIEQNEASAMCFSPNRLWLATAGNSNDAGIWAPAPQSSRLWSALPGLSSFLRFSPDGKYLAWIGTRTASGMVVAKETGGTLKLLESTTGREMWVCQHDAPIAGVAFSADGQMVATSAEGAVRVWETGTGTEGDEAVAGARNWFASAGSVPGYPGAVESPNQKLFAIAVGGRSGVEREPGSVEVRDAADHSLQRKLLFNGAATSLAWSSDSRWLASGHVDGAVRLWDITSGIEKARFHFHIDVVAALAFSPGGEFLASAGYDEAVILWRARYEDLIGEACSRLTRNLTLEEWGQYMGEEEYRETCSLYHPAMDEAGQIDTLSVRA